MDMELFSTYQRESRKTWGVIDVNHPIVYPTLGLVNEAGEVAGKIKDLPRHGGAIGEPTAALKHELGDAVVPDADLHRSIDAGKAARISRSCFRG